MRVGIASIALLAASTANAAPAAHTGKVYASRPTSHATLRANVPDKAHPDFSGMWERYPDPFAGGVDYPPPPGGPPPLREPYASQFDEAVKKRDETLKKGELIDDPSTRCLPEGMPTIMGGIYALEFVQTPKQLFVLAEFLTQTRRIYIDQAMPPKEETFPSYNGYSVAHWEGDTLVVQTQDVRENVRFMNMPRSADMQITERIRLTSPDQLEDHVVIDDPTVLTKPYAFTFGYRRLKDYKISEYICDNNRYSIGENGEPALDADPNKNQTKK